MDRRDFCKKSILTFGAFLALNAITLASSFAGVVLNASEGKLGYKNESRFPNKNCLNCKHYRAGDGEESGECVLVAMRNVMKAEVVVVDPKGHCNMWAKIS